MTRLLRAAALRTSRRSAGDDTGVTLVETIVAIALIGLVMSALITFFVGSIHATNGFRSRQAATVIGDQAIEQVRSVSPDQLIIGRDCASEQALYAQRVALIGYNPDMADVCDTNTLTTGAPGSGANAVANTRGPATVVAQVVNNVKYYTYYEIGICYQLQSATSPGDCTAAVPTPPPGATVVMQYRVVVSVHFPATGTTCTALGCRYVTTTLINPNASLAGQPQFNNNVTSSPTRTS